MIEEILRRRFHNDWPYPDLIVLDGGKGQLSAGFKVLAELKLDINCIALAKKFERIYIKGKKNPISLPRDSKALHVLQRLRDEAHRFAINYHRHLRDKRSLTVQKSSASLIK